MTTPESSPGISRGRLLTTAGVLLACVALLGTFGYRLLSSGGGGDASAPRINNQGQGVDVKRRPAPGIELETYDGQNFSLAELRGKVVVLNFWSSWCPPCRDEAPVFERTWQQHKDRNVVVLGVNVWDKDKADAKEFLLEHGITYPNGAPKGAVAAEYGLTGIPETFVVDPEGMVVKRWQGPLEDAELNNLIASATPPASTSGR